MQVPYFLTGSLATRTRLRRVGRRQITLSIQQDCLLAVVTRHTACAWHACDAPVSHTSDRNAPKRHAIHRRQIRSLLRPMRRKYLESGGKASSKHTSLVRQREQRTLVDVRRSNKQNACIITTVLLPGAKEEGVKVQTILKQNRASSGWPSSTCQSVHGVKKTVRMIGNRHRRVG